MNPAADQALVTLSIVAAIFALMWRKSPRNASMKKGNAPCSNSCVCARATDRLIQTPLHRETDSSPKLVKSDQHGT